MMKPYRVRRLTITESTNTDAKNAAASGEVSGLVVWALQQTGGRGRHGRSWDSPPGNLYSSLLLRPNGHAGTASRYAFVASLAIRDLVAASLPGTKITLKWPNDVLADGKKISGLLLESSLTSGGQLEWLVVGIGLNVTRHPTDTLYPATSLKAEGAPKTALDDLLDRLWRGFYRWHDTLDSSGFAAIREAWLARAETGKMSVRLPKGPVGGLFAGINEEGGLLLQLADGTKQAISAGDVFFNN